MQISVEILGASKVGAFLEAFPKETGRAVLRALKRGTAAAGTHANRVISSDMGLKVGDVRKRIRIVDPNAATLSGELRGSLRRIPLIEFGATGPEPSRGRGRGVRARIGRGGRGTYPRAFITRVGSGGHRGVFERASAPRLPIRELFGPSIGRVMSAHQRDITARGTEQFEKELDRLLDRIIQGSVGAGDA